METIMSVLCLCVASLTAAVASFVLFKSPDQAIPLILWAIFMVLVAIYGKMKW